jgi:hypothetical protein
MRNKNPHVFHFIQQSVQPGVLHPLLVFFFFLLFNDAISIQTITLVTGSHIAVAIGSLMNMEQLGEWNEN